MRGLNQQSDIDTPTGMWLSPYGYTPGSYVGIISS